MTDSHGHPSPNAKRPAILVPRVFAMVLLGLATALVSRPASTAEPNKAAGDAAAGIRSGSGLGSYGKGTIRLFGLTGEGHKFVYAFDRSGSTGGSGQTALNAAKAELIASLDDLERVQQFQIIFYNEKPLVFNPAGQPGRLAFGTDSNKEHARRFINSVTAEGATDHEEALKTALRLGPDVIFFLTDAGDPQLEPQQLERIRLWAVGISINVIEFGRGPQPQGDNFLMRLARENAGQYTYVDVANLASTGKEGQ